MDFPIDHGLQVAKTPIGLGVGAGIPAGKVVRSVDVHMQRVTARWRNVVYIYPGPPKYCNAWSGVHGIAAVRECLGFPFHDQVLPYHVFLTVLAQQISLVLAVLKVEAVEPAKTMAAVGTIADKRVVAATPAAVRAAAVEQAAAIGQAVAGQAAAGPAAAIAAEAVEVGQAEFAPAWLLP